MSAKGGNWPSQDDIIDALVGLSIESLGGKSAWRKDHRRPDLRAGPTTNNKYDFVTLGTFRAGIPRSCGSRRGRISGNGSRPPNSASDPTNRIECPRLQTLSPAACFTPPFCSWWPPGFSSCSACRRSSIWRGSFYALGAYFGITFIKARAAFGVSKWLILPALIVSVSCSASSGRRSSACCALSMTATRASNFS